MSILDNIKKLREITGISILECKKALLANDNDVSKSIVYLRKSGILNVSKLSDRVAKEGVLISMLSSDRKDGVVVELNCETDFVSRSLDFIEYANKVANFFLFSYIGKSFFLCDKDLILNQELDDAKINLISKFKENLFIKRVHKVNTVDGFLFNYVHFDNKICVLICVDKDDSLLCSNILIQIASMAPKYLCIEDVPSDILFNEKVIYFDKFKIQHPDKDSFLLDKMVDGQLNKFFKTIVLLEQDFVKNPKISIKTYLNDKLIINFFNRFVIGD